MSQNREHPGNLPLLPMGWGAAKLDFDGTDNFWEEVQTVISGSSLGESLDLALAGESSPRIWLILHEPGHGALSTAAALGMAQELGERDQAVLVLDCDDTDSKLTRWAGRHESEGWIDLVRYGASVLTGGVALPFSGRRGYVLGVGSFTPTDVVFSEAQDLVNRLKRQADDLILVAPANEAGKLWAGLADIRLLCWDRARKSPELIARVCQSFEESGNKLTGLVGFGLPEEGMVLGAGSQSSSEEVKPPRGPIIEDEEAFAEEDSDDRLEAADINDVDYTDAEEFASEPDEQEVAAQQIESAVQDEDLGDTDEDYAAALAADPGSGSSRVFWGAAVVSLLLIAVVSFYYLKFVRPGEEDIVAQSSPVAEQEELPLPAQEPMGVVADDTSAVVVSQDSIPTGTADDLAEVEDSQPTEPAADPTAMEQASAEVTAPEETQPEVVEVRPPAFDLTPYQKTVGVDGWALHLFSLPDSPLAEAEARRLERRGFQTSIRPFESEDKGLWYRVYVGSFPTKSAAREAQGPLMKKLKVDWARATRF